jgi:hypothetical protein
MRCQTACCSGLSARGRVAPTRPQLEHRQHRPARPKSPGSRLTHAPNPACAARRIEDPLDASPDTTESLTKPTGSCSPSIVAAVDRRPHPCSAACTLQAHRRAHLRPRSAASRAAPVETGRAAAGSSAWRRSRGWTAEAADLVRPQGRPGGRTDESAQLPTVSGWRRSGTAAGRDR